MLFKYSEYDQFFHNLLCDQGESITKYASLFDFREPPAIKRRELKGRNYTQAWDALERQFGRKCQLQLAEDCEINNPTTIDHLIPISSNVLSKHLRKSKSEIAGKKVPTESFGSNNLSNLVLACARCNSHKKHRFLDKERMKRILKEKDF